MAARAVRHDDLTFRNHVELALVDMKCRLAVEAPDRE